MKAPFETLTVPQSEAKAYLAAFDRPGHVALVVGPWFHEEFEEFVENFEDPQTLIQQAREIDIRDWVALQLQDTAQFATGMNGLLEALMGPLTASTRPGASDAEKYIHAARQSFSEEENPAFIQDLEEVLQDANRVMNVEDSDPMPDVLAIMDRLQKIGDQTKSLDHNIRAIQTIGQFFVGEQIAKATGAEDVLEAMFGDAEPENDDAAPHDTQLIKATGQGDTVIAILPVDDPWAALAWMQHGSYSHHAVALLAAARDMAKRHGAVPVMATCDSLGFEVAKPATKAAEDVARTFEALGATTLNEMDVSEAAPHLIDSNEWRVWWD